MNAALAKIIAALLPERYKKKAGSIAFAIILTCIGIPILLLLVIFNPIGSLDEEQNEIYVTELNSIGCGQHEFYLDEVRLYESYLVNYVEGYSMEDAAEVRERLRSVYFHKGWFSSCVMKDDTTILQILNQEYGLPAELNDAILEDLAQLRFEREKVKPPLRQMGVRQNYGVLDLDGIELTTSVNAEVMAALSGTVESVEYLSEEIELEIECPPPPEPEEGEEAEPVPEVCSVFVPLGKTVTIRHEMITGINESADYEKEVIYTQYAHLGETYVHSGDEVNQQDKIARVDGDEMFFRMFYEDGTRINPEDYLYLYYRLSDPQKEELEGIDIQHPLQTPYVLTAGVGIYDPFGTGATMHYGVDMAGNRNDPIYSATSGTVIYSAYNSTGGNQVNIQAENGYIFIYAHMNEKAMVNVGDTVSIGEQIGRMGDTGKVTGVHLHFEIRDPAGNVIDPREILDI